MLEDYVAINWPTIDGSSSVKIEFNYVRVGAADYWQYYIIRVDVDAVTSIKGHQTLYIDFVEVSNTQTLYVP